MTKLLKIFINITKLHNRPIMNIKNYHLLILDDSRLSTYINDILLYFVNIFFYFTLFKNIPTIMIDRYIYNYTINGFSFVLQSILKKIYFLKVKLAEEGNSI